MNTFARAQRRSWPVILVFVLIVALQLLVAAASIEVIAAVRSYVTGENLYSKGQKDAQIYLLAFAADQREDDYQRFLEALNVPLSDRAVREELEKPHPDRALAARHALNGGIHPEDVDGVIRLFEWFHEVPAFAAAIRIWVEGDGVIAQMRSMADDAHREVASGLRQGPALVELRRQALMLNTRLSLLESQFSAQLGEASRETQRLLLAVNLAVALILGLSGAAFIRYNARARALTEAALHEGEQRMTRLVDTVNDGVITVADDDRIVLFNRAAQTLFGKTPEQAIGQPVDLLIRQRLPRGPAVALADPRPQSKGGAPGTTLHDLTGLHADGHSFPLQASLSSIQTERGSLLTAVLRDVTEMHQAEAERRAREKLEAAGRAKTEFLSRMSHELRTPLNAVLGFSQLMRVDRYQPPTAGQLERIRHIEDAGVHLLALVNDVLDLSRVEEGQMTLSPEPVDVQGVSREAMSIVASLAAGQQVAMLGPRGRAGVPAAGVWVLADRVRLRQVLVNLLTNAVKYNRPTGSVEIVYEAHEGWCTFEVADTGRGMTAEQLAHLFEPFNRLGAEHSKIEGTGIGLVLSRRLAELMEGELTVASTEGRGTTATLRLKHCDPPTVAASVKAPPSQHGLLDGPLNVLYAEDNEVNVALVEQIVTFRPAIRLRVAENGARALEMARSDPPDLILLDMNLGDMTGLELVRQLRQQPGAECIRLVALSADALPEQINAALADGFEAYLTKPMDFRQLLNVLDRRL